LAISLVWKETIMMNPLNPDVLLPSQIVQ